MSYNIGFRYGSLQPGRYRIAVTYSNRNSQQIYDESETEIYAEFELE